MARSLMNHSIRFGIVAACTLLLSSTIAVRPTFADLLTGSYMLPSSGAGKIIPFLSGQFDANPITMGLCFPEDLIVDVTPYFIMNPFVAIGLNDGMMTPQFKVNCTGIGEATFSFVAPSPDGTANVDFNNFPAPSGQFSSEVNLINDQTGLFGGFQDALLILTFAGLALDPNGDGRAAWPVPPGGTVNVKLQLISIPRPVPEPTTLALVVCGLFGLAGVGCVRRRSRQ